MQEADRSLFSSDADRYDGRFICRKQLCCYRTGALRNCTSGDRYSREALCIYPVSDHVGSGEGGAFDFRHGRRHSQHCCSRTWDRSAHLEKPLESDRSNSGRRGQFPWRVHAVLRHRTRQNEIRNSCCEVIHCILRNSGWNPTASTKSCTPDYLRGRIGSAALYCVLVSTKRCLRSLLSCSGR